MELIQTDPNTTSEFEVKLKPDPNTTSEFEVKPKPDPNDKRLYPTKYVAL